MRRGRLGWIVGAGAALVALAAAGSTLAGAQGDDTRRGTDPLSADEIQAAIADSEAPPEGATESTGANGLPERLVLLVERHLEDKEADAEQRRADVYEYHYATDTLTVSVVDLVAGVVDEAVTGQGDQLPLVEVEEQRALELLFADEEFAGRLAEEFRLATGRDLGDPATDLQVDPIVFYAGAMPTVAQGAAADCGISRCAQFLIQTTDHVLINLFPLVDLSAGDVLTADGVAGVTSVRRTGVAAALALLLAGVTVVPVLSTRAEAAEPLSCSAEFQIDETLTSGGRWQMCWERRGREGVLLHEVSYTPPGGDAVEVLGRMNLAQIHVPYDNNVARFHDESDFGLGFNLEPLDAGDCPGGELLSDGVDNVLCQQVRDGGYAYKAYNDQAQDQTLSLFSVSAIGAYNYVVAWNFDGDGAIRPEVGATGELQIYGADRSTGWNTGSEFGLAVAHMHNFYWRLDFDLDGAENDRVQELDATLTPSRETFTNTRTPFLRETARRVSPRSMRSWRVLDTQTLNADDHRISYEVLPNADYIFRGPGYEPFTQNEFYATTLKECERFASHNFVNGGCGGNLAAFADGESLAGEDLVTWYGTSFHHLPRDEDEPHMDVHWSGFTIAPRDLTATHPIP